MDLIGLATRISASVISIDAGRKGFATRGKEQEGRILFEDGIDSAMSAFQEAQISADAQTLILAEFTFLSQELQLCDKTDKDTINSLTQAVESFNDAFLAHQVVENGTSYKDVDKTYPHKKEYRVSGYPKDAFHIACISHRTRLQNIIRAPGIDPIEKSLLKQRFANLSTAQSGYVEMQKKAMGN